MMRFFTEKPIHYINSKYQIITQTLKDYRLIEHMEMGVRNKIINGMLRFNQKEPEFVVDEYQVKVILYK